jgi:homogentisate 1,2-dioxygenase
VEAAVNATHTDETAVMIDTFAPLQISEAGRGVADPDYPWSWARPLS